MERGNSTFEQCYRCYPVSFIDKAHLEKGDKVIMPPSALDRLEFVADEGLIYLPYWMMENMLLQEGDIVQVKNASLTKGTYVKLQPHTKDFLDISNPKAILETTLRSYSCLTVGDTIMVPYNNKKYYINIVETKPSPAVSIIETDCEVDFAPPLDYKEPEKPAPSLRSNKMPPEVEEEPPRKIPKFSPFSGSARRLDGKPLMQPAALPISRMLKPHNSNVANETVASKTASSTSSQQSGKLVFGLNGNQPPKEATKVAMKNSQDAPKEEKPKFQAFTGKKYSLKG
ncbi:ubiquitin fusion degradation protein 1 homolog isoform X2 [Durio zibethinus]|uniref:Ubiquitin fusion degradation protein 1 homolog isoform X2 n=1 Tax=Durio zibethinus TaxID=66656 RepID=A0A6P5ZTR3_DURZI|nr:ubiquitin fusion degradation protein 1 homolog isoform X2 [Durio zibethinus]